MEAGWLGFIRTFKNAEDPVFNRIISFCNLRGFFKIQSSVDDELLFTLPGRAAMDSCWNKIPDNLADNLACADYLMPIQNIHAHGLSEVPR